MSLVICTGGLVGLLNAQKSYLNKLTLHLFQNDHEPSASDTADDFIECDFPSYESQKLDNWGDAYENDEGEAQIDEDLHTFVASDDSNPNSVFGYYCTDLYDRLVFAELLANAPFEIEDEDTPFQILVNFTNSSQ